jgi:hypothetical protein
MGQDVYGKRISSWGSDKSKGVSQEPKTDGVIVRSLPKMKREMLTKFMYPSSHMFAHLAHVS